MKKLLEGLGLFIMLHVLRLQVRWLKMNVNHEHDVDETSAILRAEMSLCESDRERIRVHVRAWKRMWRMSFLFRARVVGIILGLIMLPMFIILIFAL